MAIEKVYLDPNAAAYADLAALDSTAATKLAGIAAGAEVNPADLATLDSVANTKLAGIDAGAEVNPAATEIRDSIVGLADDDRQIIIKQTDKWPEENLRYPDPH